MQTHFASQSFAERAPRSLVPPSWSDLAFVLKFGCASWILIVFFALARSAFRRFLQTNYFRTLKETQKNLPTESQHIIFHITSFFRNIRVILVRNRYPETTTAFFFGLPRSIAGLLICILYIIDTYLKEIPTHFYVFQCAYGIAILFNLIFSFLYAERPVLFAFSLRTAIEAISIPSLLFSSGTKWLNFNFLQAYCILAEWCMLEKHDIVMRNTSTLTRLLTNLFLQLLTFLFITSCGVQFFELLGDPSQVLRSETFQITWANSVYFAVVTLMTVGYGDFVPYTLLGRMWIVFHIIFAAYLVSREISLLIDALKSMRRGGGSYVNSSGTDHVVVTGKVKWEFLQQFVKEFLAEGSNLDTRIIVLTSNPAWTDDDWHKFVSHNPLFDHHLFFLDGSALKMDDLGRAQVGTAKGVFVLADPHRQDPYREDSDILKAVLTIRNYSGEVPIYALNTLTESSFQFGIAAQRIDKTATEALSAESNLQMPSIVEGPSAWATSQANKLQLKRVERPEQMSHDETNMEDMITEVRHEGLATPFPNGRSQDNYSLDEYPNSPPRVFDDGVTDEGLLTPQTRSLRKQESRRSQSLCMQELETVLLAENTFCNGLSTLIANATLRIAPQSSRNDRPWLVEYKLGAECSVQEFKIRHEMNGLRFGKIATILQDYGLVLLVVREKPEADWSVLTPETILTTYMSTMAMTYHDPIVVDRIADLAAKYIHEKLILARVRARARTASVAARSRDSKGRVSQRRRIFTNGAKPSPETANIASSSTDRDPRSIYNAPSSSTAVPGKEIPVPVVDEPMESRALNHDRHRHQQKKKLPSSSLARSLSTSAPRNNRNHETGARKKEEVTTDARGVSSKSGNVMRRPRGSLIEMSQWRKPTARQLVYTRVDKLPAALRGHIIVCLEGESPLLSLEALLRRIWMPRIGQRKKAPVVIIHPRFPKAHVRALQREGDHLFLLQGNSLSLETLRQAQYQSARAVLIMTSESDDTKGQGSIDSKAIFTVMTLDSLLADRDTFVCCVLDAEESLRLLRAPRQPRRVGVNLGEQREPDVFNLSAYYERSPQGAVPKRVASSNFVKSMSSTPFIPEYNTFAPFGAFGGGSGFHLEGRRNFTGRSGKALKLRLKGMTRSSSMRMDEESSDEEYQNGLDMSRLPEQNFQQQLSREELYERQRYASGEMVISSFFTALLARDYTDPGYIRLIRQLIGASSASTGSWIRQIEIPESWTRAENEIDGRTYRDTSIRLLRMGCIALGLYRSGDAPVRIETKSDQWERRTDEVVYHEEEDISRLRRDAESKSVVSRMTGHGGYSNRLHGRVPTRNRMQDAPTRKGTVEDVPFHERFAPGDDEGDEFDQMYYTCPTTKRRIFYYEAMDGANVLPYVYSCPEPYSLVAASDAVFVLCDPMREIPSDWEEESNYDNL